MVTETERARLRADVGADKPTLPDVEADEILTEAGESYSDGASAHAQARVIAIRRLLASAAKLVSYRQNNSSENASDVYKHLAQLLEYWEGQAGRAIRSAGGSTARFGSLRRSPRRVREYPGRE